MHHVWDKSDQLRENHQNSDIDHCHENKGGNVLDDTLDLGVGRVRRNVQADADRRSQVADSNVADNSNAKRDLVDAGSLHDGKQNGNEHDLHGRTLKEKAADEKYKGVAVSNSHPGSFNTRKEASNPDRRSQKPHRAKTRLLFCGTLSECDRGLCRACLQSEGSGTESFRVVCAI